MMEEGKVPVGDPDSKSWKKIEEWVKEALRFLESLQPVKDLAEVPVSLLRDGVLVVGKVDRLLHLPDGSWAVVDFKTGAAPAREGAVRLDLEDPYHFQVAVYGLACRSLMKGTPGKGYLCYLEHGKVIEFDLGAEQLDATESELDARVLAAKVATTRAPSS
jgi:ATP-dependent exoDNAse (exonuclease V) beta subunit